MGVPVPIRRTVVDAARELIHATDRLQAQRREADRTVAELETRWAANRRAKCRPISPVPELPPHP